MSFHAQIIVRHLFFWYTKIIVSIVMKRDYCKAICICIVTDVKATNVVRVSSKNVNIYITYKSGYPKGSSVYLRIADYNCI